MLHVVHSAILERSAVQSVLSRSISYDLDVTFEGHYNYPTVSSLLITVCGVRSRPNPLPAVYRSPSTPDRKDTVSCSHLYADEITVPNLRVLCLSTVWITGTAGQNLQGHRQRCITGCGFKQASVIFIQ